MPTPQETRTLRPSPVKLLFIACLSLGFVGIGLWLATTEIDTTHRTIGWICTAFFGLCALVVLLTLLPGANFLRVDADGFTMCALWRNHRYSWGDVAGQFGVTSIPAGIIRRKVVGFSFAPGSPRRPKSETLRQFNVSMTGYEAALNNDYGLGYDALTALMNQHLEDYRIRS